MYADKVLLIFFMSKIVFKSVSKVFTMTFLLGLTTVPVNVLTVCALAKPGVAYLFLFPLFIGVSVWLFIKVARWIAKQMQGSKACEEEMRWYEYCYVVGSGLIWFGFLLCEVALGIINVVNHMH